MIFGASIKEIFEAHGDDLTPYARHLVADSAKISKDDFYALSWRPSSGCRSASCSKPTTR